MRGLSTLALGAGLCLVAATAPAQMDHKGMGHDMAASMPNRPMKASMAQMNRMMRGWPKASQEAVMFMTKKYGAPMHLNEHTALWGQTGP